MPARVLEVDDLTTPTGLRRSCRPRLFQSPSPRRCLESPLCSPCPTRCYSTSPSVRRRRVNTRCNVPQRDLKTGRMVCDKFSTVCYPRNLSTYCGDFGDACSPLYRKPVSCSSTPCYRPCTPIRCPRGICRVSCRCPSPPPPPPYCDPCSPLSPCSPCDEPCDSGPSDRFVQAMKTTGPCSSRYQTHLCPWEANVTVSGTIRAHCTSTADEISSRLAGPFKAFGKRFTTDAESNWSTREPCCDQKLSLGILDDGCGMDFSRNNRPTLDKSNLDIRVKRIMNRSAERDGKVFNKPASYRNNHISWDKRIDYNDSRNGAGRLSRNYDRYSDRRQPMEDVRERKMSGYHRDGGNFRTHSNDRSYDQRRRGDGPPPDDERAYWNRIRGETFVDDRRGSRSNNRYYSDDQRTQGDKRSVRNPSFEIMMEQGMDMDKRRFSYTSPHRHMSKPLNDSGREDGYGNRRGRKLYEDAVDVDNSRYRMSKQGMEYAGRGDRSRNHYGFPERVKEDSRRRYGRDNRPSSSSYYHNDYNVSRLDDSRGSHEADDIKYRSQKECEELERIRFWPCEGDIE